jgi:cell division topological specificity factor MinE
MKDIFSDLYDKVLSFFTSTQNETKSVAKSRLKTVLMQDRVGFSERAMQMLKDDMIDTISKYLEINVDSFSLSIDATEENTILNFSIPVVRPRTDEEIDEAIELSRQAKIEKTQEIVGEIKELVTQKAQELAQNMADSEAEEENEEETETEEETESPDKEDSEEEDKTEDKKETEKDGETKQSQGKTKSKKQ